MGLLLYLQTTGLDNNVLSIVYDYCKEQKQHFETACKKGDVTLMQDMFVLRARILNKRMFVRGFELACIKGHTEVVKHLWGHVPDKTNAFRMLCTTNYLELIKLFAELLDSTTMQHFARIGFVPACSAGDFSVVSYLVQFLSHEDICTSNNRAFRVACQSGHVCIARYLSQRHMSIVDLQSCCDSVLYRAAEHGKLSVVQFLVELAYVSQTDIRCAFDIACMNNHLHVVTFLTTCPHVDPQSCCGSALLSAAERGKLAVVQMLMKLAYVSQTGIQYAFDMACINNHLHVVTFLATCPHVTVSAEICDIVKQKKHSDVFAFLLTMK